MRSGAKYNSRFIQLLRTHHWFRLVFIFIVLILLSLVFFGINSRKYTNDVPTKSPQLKPQVNEQEATKTSEAGDGSTSQLQNTAPTKNIVNTEEHSQIQNNTGCNTEQKNVFIAQYNDETIKENQRYQMAVDTFLATNPDPSIKSNVLRTLFDEHSQKIAAINAQYYSNLSNINCPLP